MVRDAASSDAAPHHEGLIQEGYFGPGFGGSICFGTCGSGSIADFGAGCVTPVPAERAA